MAKGGGRGKGRPRKIGIIEGIPQSMDKGGKFGGKINGTVTETEELGEEIGRNGNNEIPMPHASECELNDVSSDDTRDGKVDLEGTEGEIDQIQSSKPEAPLRNKGMKLEYVAPTLKQGTPTACLDRSEIEKENLKWKRAVILYVIGEAPSITYLSNFLKQQCNIEQKFDIYYHVEGYFVIRFETMAERDKVLYGGPHTIANRPAIVKEWMMNFNFEKEILKEIPLWIQLPNLPLNCWSNDSLSRIGSVLGKPICADECTTQQKRISYARLMVEIDVTQPLKYRVQVEGENGKLIDQKIFYEWIPLFCQKCHKIGHICKEGKKPAPVSQQVWKKRQTQNLVEEQKHEEDGVMVLPKDKGKTKMQEEWSQPKRTATATIQVGRLHIPTSNVYEGMQEEGTSDLRGAEGGGRNPLHPT